MGWNTVHLKKRTQLFSKVPNNSYFYFVHSYYAKPEDKNMVIGETNYGISFPSVIARQNVTAFQFHPEKSQKAGLQLLTNFIGA
jgi:glutamine amidotransferase